MIIHGSYVISLQIPELEDVFVRYNIYKMRVCKKFFLHTMFHLFHKKSKMNILSLKKPFVNKIC